VRSPTRYLHYTHRISQARIHQIVGWFVLVPVLILGAVLFVVGKNEHLFAEKYKITTVFSEGYGLKEGYPVWLLGIQVGRIKDVEFTDQNNARVTLALLKKYQDRIRSDSKATIGKSGGFIGDPQVEIKPGNKNNPIVPDGGHIESEEPFDLSEIKDKADRLLNDLNQKLARVDEILTGVRAAVESGKATLDNVKAASEALPSITADIHETTTSVKQTARRVSGEVPAMMKSIRTSVDGVGEVVHDVKESVAKLGPSLDNVQQATKDLSGLIHNDVPPLVRSVQGTMDDVNEIVTGAKQTFPISVFANTGRASRPEEAGGQPGLRSLRKDELTKE
jgi:ABC-type transporter Mla subunit MlaD